MKVNVCMEQRFDRTPDGTVWTQAMFGHSFWKRYLATFDEVGIVARVRDVPAVPSDFIAASGDRVVFHPVPYYLGPSEYLAQWRAVARAVRSFLVPDEAVILRAPGVMSRLAFQHMRASGRPYAVEVVGDPYDAYAPGSVKHPLRPALRWGVPWILRQQCSGACAVSYVTEHALQLRYPPAEGAFSTFYSSVELPDNVLVSAPRAANASLEQFTLISVGTLAQLYKAPDVLIRAIARCVEGGLDLTLIWIGDGKHRAELEVLAERLGLTRRVRFLGQLPAGEAIRSHLDKADIFVLPSYQEGVPRAMIEAMARGLPCIGSSVGGIPELLPSQDMVPAGDIEALTEKIAEVVSGPQRLARMSSRNLARASDYRETVLSRRRKEFYDYVERCTRMWSRSRAA